MKKERKRERKREFEIADLKVDFEVKQHPLQD